MTVFTIEVLAFGSMSGSIRCRSGEAEILGFLAGKAGLGDLARGALEDERFDDMVFFLGF